MKNQNKYRLQIAGTDIFCEFRFKDTIKYFDGFVCCAAEEEDCVSVSEIEWEQWTSYGGTRNPYAEYTCSTAAVSDQLLRKERCIIHAAAFRWNNNAWLITAPSGTGKSTQLRTLIELYSDNISVICGDRPALQIKEDGTIYVHPTPWNGKENWHGAEGAVLRGIICLKRGDQNKIVPLSPQKAIVPIYESIIHRAEDERNVLDAAAFENTLLMRVPVWELTSNEVPDSTRLLYEQVLKEEDK